jgi:NAD(P)-dependent dehydrogenase (short-subunit alcohol dehydrogenase family)
MQRFNSRAAVLTGVGREGQLGEVVARAFAEEGAALVLVDHDAHQVGQRAAALRAAGYVAHGHQCNLADPAQVEALALEISARYQGRIDALVNMAGGFAMSGPAGESDAAIWHRQFEINATTAYLTTRFMLPMLRATRGAVVNFASAAALVDGNPAKMSAYAAAKSAVIALTRAVAEEERENGVRANAVAPTAIRTAANLESMGSKIRYVEREEVAESVLFLCSEASRAVTGQILRLS